jgi:hypothetical protein
MKTKFKVHSSKINSESNNFVLKFPVFGHNLEDKQYLRFAF